MNVAKIRKHLTGGFRPFVLRTSDGREFEVPHPELIALGKYDVAVVDRRGDINVLDALYVVSIKTPRLKNGAGRRGSGGQRPKG
jgi:hypothetical protein